MIGRKLQYDRFASPRYSPRPWARQLSAPPVEQELAGANDSLGFTDTNRDGTYDVRIGPGSEFAVMIDSAWRGVTIEVKKRYIEIDGQPFEIAHVDGVWKTTE